MLNEDIKRKEKDKPNGNLYNQVIVTLISMLNCKKLKEASIFLFPEIAFKEQIKLVSHFPL